MNAERLGLGDPDREVELLVVLPHAAMNPLAVMAATASTARRGRNTVGLGRVIRFLSWPPHDAGTLAKGAEIDPAGD
jgi:hypothetical protein